MTFNSPPIAQQGGCYSENHPDGSPTLCTSAEASPGPAEARGQEDPGRYSLESHPPGPTAVKGVESESGGANGEDLAQHFPSVSLGILSNSYSAFYCRNTVFHSLYRHFFCSIHQYFLLCKRLWKLGDIFILRCLIKHLYFII